MPTKRNETMISYAQNFEDVMLSRALDQVGEVEQGFYIDVGANDPTIDSVTRTFYDRGWCGINIEPVACFHERLCSERPRDVNLGVAVGAAPGTLPFYEVTGTGLSTADAALAARHRAEGRTVVDRHVPVVTLDAVCAEHVTGPIHFLKIDVEGAEAEVLAGFDLTRWRPWILVVEATLPMTTTRCESAWESVVLQAGYAPVYFDGLNRFYLAQEHAGLRRAFDAPPNFFDGFQLRPEHGFSYPVAPLVEARAQAMTASMLGEVTASVTERVTASVTDSVTAAVTARVTESVTASVTASVTENVTASVTASVTENVTENVTASVTARVTADVTEQVTARVTAELTARHRLECDAAHDATRTAQVLLRQREAEIEHMRAWARQTGLRLERAEMRQQDAIVQAHRAQIDIVRAEAESRALREQMIMVQCQAQARIAAIHASRSWRYSRPIRIVGTLLIRLRHLRQMARTPRSSLVGLARDVAQRGWRRLDAHPFAARRIRRWLERHPRCTQWLLRRMKPTASPAATDRYPLAPPSSSAAPPGARLPSAWNRSALLAADVEVTLVRALQAQAQTAQASQASRASHGGIVGKASI